MTTQEKPLPRNRGVLGGRQQRVVYIALEEQDFVWDDRLMVEMRGLWREGYSIGQISKFYRRTPLDVFLLLMDQWQHGQVGKGGATGLRNWLVSQTYETLTGHFERTLLKDIRAQTDPDERRQMFKSPVMQNHPQAKKGESEAVKRRLANKGKKKGPPKKDKTATTKRN